MLFNAPMLITYLPESLGIKEGELSLEVDQYPAETEVEVAGLVTLCKVKRWFSY